MKTLGQNIATYRKNKNITQEKLAEICSVSPQAVSKWENDISCPDVTLLKTIARTFEISVDELLDDGSEPIAQLSRKGKLLKIRVLDKTDKVNLNLPLALIELLLQNEELTTRAVFGEKSHMLEKIDFQQICEFASLGAIGKIVEVQSEDGELVEVWIE